MLTWKNTRFFWTEDQEQAFLELKRRLTSAPLLAMPIDGGEYLLDVDAAQNSLGAVLQQWQGGQLKVIGYASRVLSPAESRYCTTRRELLGVMFGLKHYRHFLVGSYFHLRTDHAALLYLMKTPNPVGQSARYLDTLAEYDFEIVYRPGVQHRNCDALSRRPCSRDPEAPPCKQCRPEMPEEVPETEIRHLQGSIDRGALYVYRTSLNEAELLWSRQDRPEQCVMPREPEVTKCSALRTEQKDRTHTAAGGDMASIFDKELLKQQQVKDAVIGVVRGWLLEPDTMPTEAELRTQDPDIQDLFAQRATLVVEDGILYRQFLRASGEVDFHQVAVPRTLRVKFIDAVHSGRLNGHLAVQKTQQRLKEVAYWKSWMMDVQLYVARCHLCGRRRRGPRSRQASMQKALGCAVMQKVHCDLCGAFKTSRTGFKYLLTVICSFS